MVWNHLTENDEEAKCKYCDKSWKKEASKSSTSNFRNHIIKVHFNKMSDADKKYLTTGDPNTPRRANLRTFMENAPPTPRARSKTPDRLLLKYIVNSSNSMRIVDDQDLDNFLKSLNSKYTMPSRSYLETNVLEPMYHETMEEVKKKINKCQNLALTTDCWTSMNHKSFMTVTGHFIDDAGDIKRCVLDTGEIRKRHTSNNLLMHIAEVLDKYDLKDRNPNLQTYISSMYTDPDDDDTDHLIDTQSQESQSQEENQSQDRQHSEDSQHSQMQKAQTQHKNSNN